MFRNNSISASGADAISLQEFLPKIAVFYLLLALLHPLISVVSSFGFDGNLESNGIFVRRYWFTTTAFEFAAVAILLILLLMNFRGVPALLKLEKAGFFFFAVFFFLVVYHSFAAMAQGNHLNAQIWFVHATFGFLLFTAKELDFQKLTNQVTLTLLLGSIGYCALFILIFNVTRMLNGPEAVFHTPGFNNIRHIGYFLAPAACVAMAGLTTNGMRHRAGYWIAFIFILTIIFWTGSRGASLAVMAAAFTGFVFAPAFRNKISASLNLFGFLIAGLLSVALPLHDSTFGVFTKLSKLNDSSSIGDVTSDRTIIWAEAIRMIQERPAIGYGSSYMVDIPGYRLPINFNHPHTILLQIPLNWGLIGTIAILVLALLTLRSFWNARNSIVEKNLAALLAVVSLAALSLIDGALFYSTTVMLFITLLICIYRSIHQQGEISG